MKVVRFNERFAEEWDSFVAESRNGTIFNLRKFLAYHPPDKFEDHSLLFFNEKGKLTAVFPATKVDGELLSHPGATYGGLIMAADRGAWAVNETLEALLKYAHAAWFKAIGMRLSPHIFHRMPSEDLDYVLASHGFHVAKTELSSAIELRQPLNMTSSAARSTRKAEKEGIEIAESEEWPCFWGLLNQNLAERHDIKPTHNLWDIERLKGLLPDRVRLFCAYAENEIAAGTVVFVCNDVALHTFYFATDYRYQNLRPLNLLIPWLAEWARDGGYCWLNLGISTESNGKVANWGLFRFKESFGARGVVRRYWRKELR